METRIQIEQRIESLAPSVFSNPNAAWIALLSCGHKIEYSSSGYLHNARNARCAECEKIAAKALGVE